MAPQPLSLPFSGEAMRTIRERAGLDRTSLASRLQEHGHKVHRTNLGRIERGEHKPSPALLKALTEVLEVAIDDLLDTSTTTISERSPAPAS